MNKPVSSAMTVRSLKEINNLTSNDCFEEIEYDTLMQTQKDKALLILMFMIMKRNNWRHQDKGCGKRKLATTSVHKQGQLFELQ